MRVARGFAGEERDGVDGREWIVAVWRGGEGELDSAEVERRVRIRWKGRICILGLEQM